MFFLSQEVWDVFLDTINAADICWECGEKKVMDGIRWDGNFDNLTFFCHNPMCNQYRRHPGMVWLNEE